MSNKNDDKEEKLLKKFFSIISRMVESDDTGSQKSSAREMLNALAGWGGKSKDELVQLVCREIGQAVAAVLREPLDQVINNKKIQVTIELVPKVKAAAPPPSKKKAKKSDR